MKTTDSSIDPMAGVNKPEALIAQLKKLRDGDHNARSYVRGSLQWLKKHPPNKYIVPMLEKALSRY